jgi:hypothetical protein
MRPARLGPGNDINASDERPPSAEGYLARVVYARRRGWRAACLDLKQGHGCTLCLEELRGQFTKRKSPCGEGQFRLRDGRLVSVLRYSLKADEARA